MLNEKQLQQIDFNLLKVFEALYVERNMTHVAKTLFISPSAVSHAIKRLRASLGDELFVRKGQIMEPTPACQQMAPQVMALLSQLRIVLQRCGEFELKQSQQTFTVAIHEALEPIVLPKLVQQLNQHAPNAFLKSIKLDRSNMSRQLAHRLVDVVIDIARPIQAPILHANLSSDHFVVLVDKQRFSEHRLSLAHYLAAKHIVVSNRIDGNVIEDISLLQQGINRQNKVRCQSFYTAKNVIKNTDYLLTLPSIIAKQLLDDSLMVLPMPVDVPNLNTHFYWHQDSEADPALTWLKDNIKHIF
ncbi:LysR substrate-binding domain-containing protein [Shewanella intestini]|uniref:LysR family transcriptional regulator n=1 Tax=Shewanella intestini TaxID=2017544 RepID=A0ABS5I4G2_9GAMM|nr:MULTISPECIES: LysR family transcriptional regulator [Shewanella]MBR9728906.1 LysR family transcriptional regulator [Shewanella intestini]MRG37028.1 LysR family transcriptional regulator [Shewanella sp. XMDDZSB0408]